MRTILKVLIGCSALCGVAAPAFAQNSATSSTSATTTIVQPISIANNSLLSFGQVVKSAGAGTNTVTIDATNGARSIGGTGTGVLGAGTATRATYTATGEGAQTFSISAPNFNMSLNGNNLLVTTYVTGSAVGTRSISAGLLSGAIGTTGTATFGVGGSFDVANTTISGVYTGSLAVTIQYN